MAIRVIKGKVDDGDKVYVTGDVISDLDAKDEQDLIVKGVGEWVTPQAEVTAPDDGGEPEGDGDDGEPDADGEGDPESDGEPEGDGPQTGIPGIDPEPEQPHRVRKPK